MITITEAAAKELKNAIGEHKAENPDSGEVYVRVGVKGAGCSGFSWTLTLEEGVDDKKDTVHEINGLHVVVDKRSALYLEETNLDFVNDLNKRGFKFDSPNIKGKCGCGSSFSY